MGNEKEEIILQIKVDRGAAEKQIDSLTSAIEEQKVEIQNLTKANIELKKSGQENSREFVENAKQLELNKDAVSKNNSERKNLINLLKAEDNSRAAIKARLAEHKRQLDQLNTSTKEGAAQSLALEKAIKADSDALKEAEARTGTFSRNVGNYPELLNRISGGAYGVAQGFGEMSKQAIKFIATGWGAVILAVAAALGTLYVALKNTQQGQDELEKQTAKLNATYEVLLDTLSDFVLAVLSIEKAASPVTQKLAEFFKLIVDNTVNIVTISRALYKLFPESMREEIEREADAAYKLAGALQELEDRERNLSIEEKEQALQVKNLIIQSKNRTLSEQERVALLDQALTKERELVDKQSSFRYAALQVEVDNAARRSELIRGEAEALEDFAKRLANDETMKGDDKAIKDRVASALKALLDVDAESANVQEKIQNQREALLEKADQENEKRRAKAAEDAQKELDDHIKMLHARFEAEQQELAAQEEITAELKAADGEATEKEKEAEFEKFLAALAEEQRIELETQKATLDAKAGMLKDYDALHNDTTKKRLDREAKAAQREKEIDRLKNEAISGGIELITKEKSTARQALNAVFKADAIKETVINGYDAAVAAYKSLAGIPIVGPVLGAVAAGIVAAFTASQVARIVGIQFARGGKAATTGGKSHAEGGTRYYGEDGNVVELERGENWYVLNKGASREINSLSSMNVKHGGVDFADRGWYRAAGGQVAARAASDAAASQDVENIVRSTVASMTVVVTVEDINAKQSEVAGIQQRAEVITA